ncbi:MAG: HD domain-containing protein [Oligoflexia bacterium]|nr:HD domain-containing protein [Oligoflexia bacterium]
MMRTISDLHQLIENDFLLRQVHELVAARFAREKSPDPGHDLAHFLRVAFWALNIGSELPERVDPREAVIAALLHDVVPVPKNSPLRNEASRLCAEEAEKILAPLGLETDAIARISEAIRCHSFSRGETAKSPLAKALQDADRLEALGSIGIMRCISTGARMGAEYFQSEDPWATSRELDDRAFSVDHFFTKLLKLPATMTTEPGRREAIRRAGIMRDFLISLGEELAQPVTDSRLPKLSPDPIPRSGARRL